MLLIVDVCFSAIQNNSRLLVRWDMSTNPKVAGYFVYYGIQSHKYVNKIKVSGKSSTSVIISGLKSKTIYYLASTCYDSAGNESGFSPQVSCKTN